MQIQILPVQPYPTVIVFPTFEIMRNWEDTLTNTTSASPYNDLKIPCCAPKSNEPNIYTVDEIIRSVWSMTPTGGTYAIKRYSVVQYNSNWHARNPKYRGHYVGWAISRMCFTEL